jgi:CDP-glycerol glycerophosphotransferase (TagB/SpsB family)
MKTKSIILTIILAIFYPFSLILGVRKNRITFISLEHDNLSKDFKLIYDRLNENNRYELRTVLFKFDPSFWGNIKYGYACIRQLFLIQSSHLVIIDYNNFVVSKFRHRKRVKVLQLWHATGALKRFGNDVERDYRVKNYDYTIVNSDFFKPIFARAFNLLESQVMVTGIPNNDKIFDQNFVRETKQRLLEKYPILKNKKIVTYAPTFRGRISTHFREALIDLEKVHQKLGDDYLIIYKSHPLISDSKYEKNERVLYI